MESIFPESIVVRLIADKPVRKTPYQVKGVFMKQFSNEKIVPFLDGKLRNKYLYPRVQVKILNEQIYIIGLKEGVDPVLALTDNVKSFNFGNITINIEKYDVEVLRPRNINGLNQIFPRDIAFVIANKLILPNIIENRQEEVSAISNIVSQILPESILRMPVEAKAEGGDVMLWNEYIFVGYSELEDFEKSN